MNFACSELLLAQLLRDTPRRYCLPALPALPDMTASMVAVALEHARLALAAGAEPEPGLEAAFVDALGSMIQAALHPEDGDPAFQAVLLKENAAPVREYAALAAVFSENMRDIQRRVNAFAHPAKLQSQAPGLLRDTLAQLQEAVGSAAWDTIPVISQNLTAQARENQDSALQESLNVLLETPALQKLLRHQALQADTQVRQYLALQSQNGPRAGSLAASRQGAASRRRGTEVETLTIQALQTWVERLNALPNVQRPYRVVSSMRAPAELLAGHERAKAEWDAVLLQQSSSDDNSTPVWEIRLLVEAKAAADAVATDLPRLVRGLRLLANAEIDLIYKFECRESAVAISGESLAALPCEPSTLAKAVLYSSDAPADVEPRLLNAAARMKLLSAPQSLAYATALTQGRPAERSLLESLWQEVLHTQQWKAVLHQYATLQQGRALMVHVEDLPATAT